MELLLKIMMMLYMKDYTSYRVKASERGKDFKTEETVLKVEEMLLKL